MENLRSSIAMNGRMRCSKAKVFQSSLEVYQHTTRQKRLKQQIELIRNEPDAEKRRQLKSMLPYRCPHYFAFRNNHRSQADILPEEFTFQTCIDIDNKEQVEQALTRAYLLNDQEGIWKGALLHAEYSASGKLHLDIRIPVSMTITEAQKAYCEALGVDYDADCCSPERMIYITDEASQIYTSELWQTKLSDEEIALRRKAYLDRGLDIDGQPLRGEAAVNNLPQEITTQKQGTGCTTKTEDVQTTNQKQEPAFPTEYDGIPYKMIVSELCEQLGGQPAHGSRNDFIFSMACHLRHVCNNDGEWIKSIMPNYGEAQQRVNDTIDSACRRKQSGLMTHTMKATLTVCRQRVLMESAQQTTDQNNGEPAMPKKLPPVIALATSKVEDYYKPAISQHLFVGFAARVGGVKLEYADNNLMEATHMALVAAPMSSGKSCVKQPVNCIVEDLKEADQLNRLKEKEWKESMETTGANKQKPKRPEGIYYQCIDSDTTSAALVRISADAERAGNKGQITVVDEIEQTYKFAGGRDVSRLICRNFDTSEYGQERVGIQSVSEHTHLRMNICAASTINNSRKFMDGHIEDGTLSRWSISTINAPKFAPMPKFGKYDDAFKQELKSYLDKLDQIQLKQSVLVCQEAKAMAEDLCQECMQKAILTDNKAYYDFGHREVVIACRKAYILWIMNDFKWDQEVEDFCRWSFHYGMWCKFHIFGDMINTMYEKEQQIVHVDSPNMLSMLDHRFTREQVRTVRTKLGKTPDPNNQIRQWKHLGFVEEDEQTHELYKTDKYLSSHAA